MKSTLLALLLLTTGLHAATHRVIKGETLSSIARKHATTVAALKKANALTSDIIRLGQDLQLPASAPETITPPAEAGLLSTLKALAGDDLWKLQIYLDRVQFAPGKVDGLVGEFTVKAAERWIDAAPDRSLDSLLGAARQAVTAIHSTHVIPALAAKFVGTMPATMEQKVAAKTLPYESLAEFVAERYRTDLSTLRRLNPAVDVAQLKIGDSLQVPAVKPFLIESLSIGKPGTPGGTVRILHAERLLEVHNAEGHLIATFPITVGTKPEHVRHGVWQLRSFAANPTFLWDDTMLKEGRKGKTQHLLPPGPNNPVGVLWLEIEPMNGPEAHIGIHGTNDPARIGRGHSSGCIRLANWDIVRLAKLVSKNTLITWAEAAPLPTLAVVGQR